MAAVRREAAMPIEPHYAPELLADRIRSEPRARVVRRLIAVRLAESFAEHNRLSDLKFGTFPAPGQPIAPSGGPLGPLWSHGAPESVTSITE
jgi:hypothetical protein